MPRDQRRPLAGTTVLGIFSHPDDESLACGGTLARLAGAGARVALVCATRGERGSSAGPARDDALGTQRVGELIGAASALGVADVTVLDHPDGTLTWARSTEFQADIRLCLSRYQPTIVITFGNDGLYWHPDHIATHADTAASVRVAAPPAPALYCVTMRHGAMRGIVDGATARGWVAPPGGFWSLDPDAFGAEAEPPTLVVDVRPWMNRKLAALRCHRSQFGLTGPFSLLDSADTQRWLGQECFHRVPGSGSYADSLERCLAVAEPW